MTYEIISIRKRKTIKIRNPADVYDLLKSYAKKKQEYFLLITINGAHEIIAIHIVTIGLVNKTLIHPRELFIRAIKDNSLAIIVCHNHPSDNTIPSDEDKELTETIKKSGEILGIRLLDHIIIAKSGFYSFKQNNNL
jgi:DNA repair protein RadC